MSNENIMSRFIDERTEHFAIDSKYIMILKKNEHPIDKKIIK